MSRCHGEYLSKNKIRIDVGISKFTWPDTIRHKRTSSDSSFVVCVVLIVMYGVGVLMIGATVNERISVARSFLRRPSVVSTGKVWSAFIDFFPFRCTNIIDKETNTISIWVHGKLPRIPQSARIDFGTVARFNRPFITPWPFRKRIVLGNTSIFVNTYYCPEKVTIVLRYFLSVSESISDRYVHHIVLSEPDITAVMHLVSS
mmetsp:Transcript_14080/g.19719  ORF Transcript_14080/g.19719 Transcript_14080/m.19719 type:complete len:202 (-) Transcript_14080:268-873(-)